MADSPNPGDSSGSAQKDAITQQTAHTRKVLRQISRARTRLLVCLLTLPVYMVAVWMLLQNQRGIDAFMFIYMALWAAFAYDMARRRCPQCGEQFFVKTIFLNLISKRCMHCGLSATASTVSPDNGDSRHF